MDSRALSLPEPVIHSRVVCRQGAETTRHTSCVITPSSAEPPGWWVCVLLCWGCQTPVPPTPTSALFVVLGPWNQWFRAKARSGAAGGGLLGPHVEAQEAGGDGHTWWVFSHRDGERPPHTGTIWTWGWMRGRFGTPRPMPPSMRGREGGTCPGLCPDAQGPTRLTKGRAA